MARRPPCVDAPQPSSRTQASSRPWHSGALAAEFPTDGERRPCRTRCRILCFGAARTTRSKTKTHGPTTGPKILPCTGPDATRFQRNTPAVVAQLCVRVASNQNRLAHDRPEQTQPALHPRELVVDHEPTPRARLSVTSRPRSPIDPLSQNSSQIRVTPAPGMADGSPSSRSPEGDAIGLDVDHLLVARRSATGREGGRVCYPVRSTSRSLHRISPSVGVRMVEFTIMIRANDDCTASANGGGNGDRPTSGSSDMRTSLTLGDVSGALVRLVEARSMPLDG
jgi:hypothetical protein